MSLLLNTTKIDPTLEVSGYSSTTSVDNEIGSMGRFRTEFTFKNIDLKLLLGNDFEKYDYFNLELQQLIQIPQIYGGNILKNATQPENSLLNMYVSGLDWTNSSYNNLINKTEAFLTSVNTQQDLQDGNFVLNNSFELTNFATGVILNTQNNNSTAVPFWICNAVYLEDTNNAFILTTPYPDGTQVIETQGQRAGAFIETIPYFFERGIEYELSFYSTRRTGFYLGQQFSVKIGSTTLLSNYTPTSEAWVKTTLYYTPIANAYEKIRFDFTQQTTNNTTAIDLVICKKRNDTTQSFGYNQDQISYEKYNLKFKKSKQIVDLSFKLRNTNNGNIDLTGIGYNEIYPHQLIKLKITPEIPPE